MKKPFMFNQLSGVKKCVVCGKGLKRNLLEKKPDADMCYKCFREMRLRTQHVAAQEVCYQKNMIKLSLWQIGRD